MTAFEAECRYTIDLRKHFKLFFVVILHLCVCVLEGGGGGGGGGGWCVVNIRSLAFPCHWKVSFKDYIIQ